jgi:hypothetical protein
MMHDPVPLLDVSPPCAKFADRVKRPPHLHGVVHRYYLPPTKSFGVNGDSWSLWLLDQDSGSLCIVSDYGNWAHRWGRSGFSEDSAGDFRREFIRFGAGYIRNKLGYGVPDVFDSDATRKAIQEKILSYRRECTIERDNAREWWDCAEHFDNSEDFSRFLDIPGAHELFWEDARHVKHNQSWLDHLTTVTLQRLCAVIQTELESEARVA